MYCYVYDVGMELLATYGNYDNASQQSTKYLNNVILLWKA